MVGQSRSTQRYLLRPPADKARLLACMEALVKRHPRYGYRRIWALLCREGFRVNRKRIYRLSGGEKATGCPSSSTNAAAWG